MKKTQLEFTTILNDAFAQYEKRIVAYVAANRSKYIAFAEGIAPKAFDDDEIYSRIAFAILSANSPFDDSVKALAVAVEKRGHVKPIDISRFKQVPAKAKYINALARMNLQSLRLAPSESWHEYRLRLKSKIRGLGLAKASFAACLLYPMDADLACIDTWIQKIFLGHTGFKSLGVGDYLIVEAKIRAYAVCFGISTFLAQWLIWDHARGIESDHDIFPGSHKESRLAA
jgi:thermostable 8-oxoguanine DNA glycosylase